MNVSVLFEMQRELDAKIRHQHSLEHENLAQRKTLALLVELGELANETRCFKFWSTKAPSDKQVILEEYVDGIHFILSLGIEYQYEKQTVLDLKSGSRDVTLTHQFLMVYDSISLFDKQPSLNSYLTVFGEYLYLGEMLGFTAEDVEKAYLLKNEINHERQQKGY
ncbi:MULTISPECIES: dUTP diphosphatase [Bacillaceae]|uniref:dUTP diphosphatase n=1 Tax=Metabacillus sediminis TaxID=3117746 RepID=A0ABZ2NE67_9BACI|nr:dUTP diphosphatase [Bacillus sp. SJS]KZZ85924.1 dUTPase [Bacillus sp. SJS]